MKCNMINKIGVPLSEHVGLFFEILLFSVVSNLVGFGYHSTAPVCTCLLAILVNLTRGSRSHRLYIGDCISPVNSGWYCIIADELISRGNLIAHAFDSSSLLSFYTLLLLLFFDRTRFFRVARNKSLHLHQDDNDRFDASTMLHCACSIRVDNVPMHCSVLKPTRTTLFGSGPGNRGFVFDTDLNFDISIIGFETGKTARGSKPMSKQCSKRRHLRTYVSLLNTRYLLNTTPTVMQKPVS